MTNEVVVNQNGIYITYNNKIICRHLSLIRFCKSYGRKTKIYFDADIPEIAPIGLNKLLLLLPADSFKQCHANFIINLLIMDQGYFFNYNLYYKSHVIPVSRYRVDQLIQCIKYYFNIPVKKVN